jgi:hypothetical protein
VAFWDFLLTGTTPNYLIGAAGNGRAQRSSNSEAQRAPRRAIAWAPRERNKALQCTTSAAARNGLGATIKYLVNRNAGTEKN